MQFIFYKLFLLQYSTWDNIVFEYRMKFTAGIISIVNNDENFLPLVNVRIDFKFE